MCPPLAQSFTTMLEKTFEAVPFEDFQVLRYPLVCTRDAHTHVRSNARRQARACERTHTLARAGAHSVRSHARTPAQACFGREFGEKHRDYLFDLYSDLISVTRSNSEEVHAQRS
jgi:hypothetical protein